MKRLSIIIPAHNEAERIGKTLEAYGNFFRKIKNDKIIDFEIIVVINNTTDKTNEIVKKYKNLFKEITYLDFKEGGKGFAIIEGFKDALKRDNDLIGFVDADMATSPESFYDLVKEIKDCEGVIASRAIKGADAKFTFKRKITHKGFNFIARSFFFFPYKDTQCGAKLFRRKTVREIHKNLKLTKWAFDINLLYLCKKKKLKIKEIPTVWEDKEGSKIASMLKISLQMFLGVLRLRIIMSPIEPLARQVRFIARWGDKLINN